MSDFSALLLRFGLDLLAMAVLLFGFHYPRYRHKETTIAAALVNVFAFAVLSLLASVQFSVAAGFGLFAILALFTLRSEPIGKADIAYFFGSISLAVITSLQGTDLAFVLLMLGSVLLAVFVIDHPRILRSASSMRVTLDFIPPGLAARPQVLRDEFARRLGVDVVSVRILSIDYVTEVVRAEISYQAPH